MKISSSSLRKYLNCPRQYYATYVEKLEDETGDAAKLGTAIHLAMERSALRGVPATSLYDECFAEVGPTNEQLYIEGKEMMPWFDNVVSNASLLRKADGTPYVEWKFTIESNIGEEELELRGIIDRIEVTPDGSVEVIDYKSGYWYPTETELLSNVQVNIYAYAAMLLCKQLGFPLEGLRVSMAVARSDRYVTVTPDLNVVLEKVEYYKTIATRLAKGLALAEELGEWKPELEQYFPETIHTQCTNCPRWKQCATLLNVQKLVEEDPLPQELGPLLDYYYKYKAVKKIAEVREDEASHAIKLRLAPGAVVQEHGFEAKVHSQQRSRIDFPTLWGAASEEVRQKILKYLSIGVGDFNKLIKTLSQEEVELLLGAVTKGKSLSVLSVTKI